MDTERVRALLQRHFDQLLKADERLELNRLLLEWARARDLFWELARWNALLRQWGEAEWGHRDAPSGSLSKKGRERPLEFLRSRGRAAVSVDRSRVRSRWSKAGAILGAFAALLFFLNNVSLWRKPSPARDEVAPGVALLTKSSEAQWANAADGYLPGQVLRSGWVRLKGGAIQLEFIRGARVILEGPAELELISENECRLHSGKLRAYVPEPAHGFLVRSNGFDVTDLGTEFGCSVIHGGAAEVHVFDGMVSLELAGRPELGRQLQEKQALWINQDRVREIPVRHEEFLSDSELAQRELAYTKTRMAAWRQESRRLSRHPSALMYLDFESTQPWTRSLDNLARRGLLESNASIIGCEWVAGRWPTKGALQFNGGDDRLRLSLPGLHQSLTLLAWLRIDSLEEGQTSLLMTEGRLPGEFDWYLTGDGRLGFGMRCNEGAVDHDWRSQSPRLIGSGSFGSWILLGTVLDGASKTLTHYLNGKPVWVEEFAHDTLARIGNLEVGNSAAGSIETARAAQGEVSSERSFQRFRGRMDELAIFSSPLHPTEIRHFYTEGWPGNPGNSPGDANRAFPAKMNH